MKIALFAKKCKTNDGETFYKYLGTLHKKSTDEEVTVEVKFREEAGAPSGEECPIYIEFKREDANLSERKYTVPAEIDSDTGEVVHEAETRTARRLWISKYVYAGEYVDHSLDDFDE